ncbi:hypothetical protein Tco_1398605 [Tanacetum coccineum]
MPLEGIHVNDKLRFVEEPVEIMEREIKLLKQSWIPLVKVRYNSKRGLEFTWEREDLFKQKYPQLFTNRALSSTTSNALGYSTFRCYPDLGKLRFQGDCFIPFDIKQYFSRPVNLLEVKQHVSTSVKEIDYAQLGVVNQAELKLFPIDLLQFLYRCMN